MGLVFRWDPCGLACCALTWAAVGYAGYVVGVWLVLPSFPDSVWAPLHMGTFALILFLILLSHTRAMISDPGIVPFPKTALDFSSLASRGGDWRRNGGGRGGGAASADSDSEESEAEAQRRSFVGEDWTVCGRCEAYRPPRAHHCRICKRCVRKMDHHCPWINNCVGEYNQKYFLLFLFYVGVASFYALALVVLAWTFPPPERMEEPVKHQRL